MERPSWAPEEIATDRPNPARMYDALLGGSHNFAADREAMRQAVAMVPDLPKVALGNRAFLRRAVRFMMAEGIRQFLDIGAGIPTVGNTHEIAHAIDPQCRVVYVDIDPVAVTHANAMLKGNPAAIAVRGDLRHPEALLSDPQVREFLDFDQPIGVLLIAVLHMLSDAEDPRGVAATLRELVPAGSYVAISHLTTAHRPDDAARLGAHAVQRSRVPIFFRSYDEIAGFFDGLTVVEPGLVGLAQWRPESPDDVLEPPERSLGLAGVGRKD